MRLARDTITIRLDMKWNDEELSSSEAHRLIKRQLETLEDKNLSISNVEIYEQIL